MKLASAAQMKELDRQAIQERGIVSVDLMEQAAEALFRTGMEALSQWNGPRTAAILCGAGNNGGDGIAVGRMLFLAGVRVRVLLVGQYEKLTPEAMEETRRLSECGVELEPFDAEDGLQKAWVHRAGLCIDAVLGVGLSREIVPGSPFAAAVEWMNGCRGTVVAADIPSGVAADTGEILGCAVQADETVTFTLPKIGQFCGPGAVASGTVSVASIGVPPDLVRKLRCPVQTVEQALVRQMLPPRKRDGHKGTFGKLLVVGGAVGYTGAPCLSAAAALRSGCGMVSLGVPEEIWPVVAGKCSASMPFPLPSRKGMLSESAGEKIRQKLEGMQVLALGPGLGRSLQMERLVRDLLLGTALPVVLDADGLNALSAHIDILDARRGCVTILTPHDGEFQRLAPGALDEGDRIGAARNFAQKHGCILVLKGYRTIIAAPEGNVLVNTTGNSGLAKGGSGDVLTGIIASLLAQGASPVLAAAGGVWLHGRAGDLAAERLTEYAMTPEDVITALPAAFREVLSES